MGVRFSRLADKASKQKRQCSTVAMAAVGGLSRPVGRNVGVIVSYIVDSRVLEVNEVVEVKFTTSWPGR